MKCQTNSSLNKVSQFELVTIEYINKKKEKKKSEKTDCVEQHNHALPSHKNKRGLTEINCAN